MFLFNNPDDGGEWGHDYAEGHQGADYIDGGYAGDTIRGHSQNDTIHGSQNAAMRDYLIGNFGNDTIKDTWNDGAAEATSFEREQLCGQEGVDSLNLRDASRRDNFDFYNQGSGDDKPVTRDEIDAFSDTDATCVTGAMSSPFNH